MHIHLLFLFVLLKSCQSLSIVMMGARRGKGGLKQTLQDSKKISGSKGPNALNGGKGQEITGVTLPAEGTLKGWEFGGNVQIACANVAGELFAIQGDCPRCAFDLYKGDLITDSVAWDDVPRVACPTCSTTFGLRSGKHGPPLKRSGLSAFVGNLAMTATKGEENKDARVFKITRDEDGRVFCRDLILN